MKLQISNDAIRSADKAGHVMLAAAVLAACTIASASAFLIIGPVAPPTSVRAKSTFPIGPADREVAARYGTIDHSLVNDPNIVPDHDPVPTF